MDSNPYKQTTEYTVEHKAHEEGLKLHFDGLKHLTTLNTGAILLVSTFWEKMIVNTPNKNLVVISLFLFAISILLAVLAMAGFATQVRDIEGLKGEGFFSRNNLFQWIAAFSYTVFIIGIGFIIIFTINS